MRYLVCSDRKVLGPFKPSELLSLTGFDELSMVCPENRSGTHPHHWQKVGNTPELMELIRGVRAGAAARPEAAAVDPAVKDRDRDVLAALDRRIGALEQGLPAREEAPARRHGAAAEKAAVAVVAAAAPAPAPAPEVKKEDAEASARHAELHARIDALEDKLSRTHEANLKALGEVDHRTQKGLREVASKMEGLMAAGAAKAVQETKAGTHWLINWSADLAGIEELTKNCGDYKAALGGLLTVVTGFAGVAAALAGFGTEILKLHGGTDWLNFVANLPHDKFSAAIGVCCVAIGTGFHQIGAANNHAAILDSHANLAAQMSQVQANQAASAPAAPAPKP